MPGEELRAIERLSGVGGLEVFEDGAIDALFARLGNVVLWVAHGSFGLSQKHAKLLRTALEEPGHGHARPTQLIGNLGD